MKLTDELKMQTTISDENMQDDARKCLAIAEKLKEISDGHIWSSQWRILVDVRWVGKYPQCTKLHRPSKIGKIFLKGIGYKELEH